MEISQNRELDDSADFIPTANTHHEAHDLHSNELPHTVVLSKDLGTMKKKVRANVIRFHQRSMTKEPELYFYNKMLLFLPWRNEGTDMLAGYESYCDEHYHSERVGWLVGFGFNGPLRQYFSLYRAASQREEERRKKG